MDSDNTAPLLTRIRDTFVAPGRLPVALAPGQPWLDVLLISTLVAVLSVLTVPDQVFLEPMQDAVTRRGEPVEITSAPETVARWGRWMGMLATLWAHPAIALALAGALTVVFSMFMRGPAGFREFLALACHVLLIPAVGTILSTAVRLAFGVGGDPTGEDVGAGIALVLSIDPFVIWMLVALAIAIHTLDPRRSSLRTGALLVGTYLVLSLASSTLLGRLDRGGAAVPASAPALEEPV